MSSLQRRLRVRGDDGTALVEFFWLGILLLVPITYAILFAFSIQRASFAVTEATRSAGRAFVTTEGGAESAARERAFAAAGMTMADHGVPFSAEDLTMQCSDCFAAGTTLHLEARVSVALPGLSAFGIEDLDVTVTGQHDAVFDEYVNGAVEAAS